MKDLKNLALSSLILQGNLFKSLYFSAVPSLPPPVHQVMQEPVQQPIQQPKPVAPQDPLYQQAPMADTKNPMAILARQDTFAKLRRDLKSLIDNIKLINVVLCLD